MSKEQEYKKTAQEQLIVQRKRQNALRDRLREAVSLASTYLDDGAPYSALRVLREAVTSALAEKDS